MAPAASRLTPRGAWWPYAGLVLLAAALPATAVTAWHLLSDPAPRSLAAGVPVVAAVWAWLLLRDDAPRDGRVRWAGPLLALATAAALAGLIAGGAGQAQRLVLLAPLAAALVLAHGGLALLRRLAGPLGLLLLAWPWPHDLVSAVSTPPLLTIGGEIGGALAAWCGAGITPAGQPGQWRLLTPEGVQLAGLDASCSGAGGLMALLILAVPVLALRRPAARQAVLWLALGLLVVLLGNGLRIGALFWLGATRGFDAVFTQVHVHAGNALVLLTWGGMLAALPLLGAGRAPPPPPACGDPPRDALPLLLCLPGLLLCAAIDLLGVPPPPPPPRVVAAVVVPEPPAAPVEPAPEPLVERPTPPAPPPPTPSPPVEKPVEKPVAATPPRPLPPLALLPAVPGYKRWAHGSFPWVAGMFGAEARAERLVYQRGPEGRLLWIDVLVCPQIEAIERHTVAGCFGSHAYAIERSEGVQVAGSDVGLWVVADATSRRWAVAAWTQAAVPLGEASLARRTTIWRRIDAGTGDAELAEVEILANGLLAPPRK